MVVTEDLVDKTTGALIAKLKANKVAIDEEKLRKAVAFTIKAHGTQKRASGDPFFQHPVEVASILCEKMRLDQDSVITALLHDTIEDTDVTLEEVEKEFGKEIAKLVDGVTKLTKIEFQPDNIRQAENFRKMLVAISSDIRVLLIKLADRLHNMYTLHFFKKPEKRQRIAYETIEIYAPLAERIGMQAIKEELQDWAFKTLHEEAYKSIQSRLEYMRETGKVVVDSITENLKKTMEENGIKAVVTGREKTPYSIWRKMEKKKVSFEQLSDIMAFRIIVGSVQECYQALGVIHSNYHMVPSQFKDFISTPKDNGYRSLHTVVMGVENQRIEVQIRTKEMHEIAEMGVAAHWSYKQDRDYSTDGKEYRWIREMLYVLEHASGPEEYLDNTKLSMYHDQVFCFTPKGTLIALPNSSTPVDFAYAVHSDVGNSCVGAKVNGRIVPLRHKLKNGDQVEIIRSKTSTPSASWEKFVVTGKAKSEIKRFIRNQQRGQYLALGKTVLEKAFEQEGIEFSEKIIEPVLNIFKKKTNDDLYVAVGEGLISKNDILRAVAPQKPEPPTAGLLKKVAMLSMLKSADKKEETSINKPSGAAGKTPIKGLIPGMAVHFAGCCHPIPGDKIVGIINTGRGVTIHTAECDTLEDYANTPERWIAVSWEKRNEEEGTYVGRIKAVLSHESGSLGTVANTIAKDMGNIINLKIINRAADFFELIIDLEVRDTEHLSHIMASLRAKPSVYSVERYSG